VGLCFAGQDYSLRDLAKLVAAVAAVAVLAD
jgi:hypothetical protein